MPHHLASQFNTIITYRFFSQLPTMKLTLAALGTILLQVSVFAAPGSSPIPDATTLTSEQLQPVRFCTTSPQEEAKCVAMKENFESRNLSPGVQCLHGQDKYHCMQLVEEDKADLISAWSMDAYVAGKYHRLRPLLQEKHTEEAGASYAYYAMAVIRKSDDSIHSLEDLRGKKSCHTGVNRHVGWLYPMSQLIHRGLINSGDCINNVANMANFFNQSCASGANNPAWDPKGEYTSKICALCGGEGDKFCTKDDPYASYEGSLKCLLDGRGDVAFIKDTTFGQVIKERPDVANQKGDYELLCLDGSRKSVDEYKECNWGKIPERVTMTSSGMTAERRREIISMLQTAAQDQSTFKLFDSASYGGKHLLFYDDTKSFQDVSNIEYDAYLGDYMDVRKYQYLCEVPALKWCTISDAEQKKCYRMRDGLAARFVKPDVECVQGSDTNECIRWIQDGKADVIALDGGDIYTGGKDHGLQIFMSEDAGKGDAKYWAVAVVKKNNTDITFTNLKGKKSCHTGIGRSAGWTFPVGAIISSQQITVPSDCDIPKAVGEFFSQSCAPGALSPEYNPKGENPASLCELCAGAGTEKCSRSTDPFSGYDGAFRCMATGAGDVAFVKHLTPGQNTDGHNQDEWAKELHSSDYQLLCKDGTRKDVTEYETCHLAKVPAHGLATNTARNVNDVERITRVLILAEQYYGAKNSSTFSMFTSGPGNKNLLFTDSTVHLQIVPEEKRNYRLYLGDTADNVYDHILSCGTQQN